MQLVHVETSAMSPELSSILAAWSPCTASTATWSSPWTGDPGRSLDQALVALAERQPRRARVVELRGVEGLTIEETARALDLSPEAIEEDLNAARAFLSRHLCGIATG